jgi:transcriptional regulator with XRE-family HTH domain
MPKISPSQIRAARALLNWSRADLAKLSGVSEPTIHRFENGVNEPETRTANKILEAFDKHGVEFSYHQGVRFKPNNIDVYDGIERFNDFYNFFYEHLDQFGGDVCLSIYNEPPLQKFRKDPNIHRRRMKKLHNQKKLRSFRILATISHFNPCGYAAYRWLPKQPPTQTAFYAFGDCLALMSFVNEKSPYIIVIRSGPLAEGYRQNFNIAWQLGEPPPPANAIAKMCAPDPSYAEYYKGDE